MLNFDNIFRNFVNIFRKSKEPWILNRYSQQFDNFAYSCRNFPNRICHSLVNSSFRSPPHRSLAQGRPAHGEGARRQRPRRAPRAVRRLAAVGQKYEIKLKFHDAPEIQLAKFL